MTSYPSQQLEAASGRDSRSILLSTAELRRFRQLQLLRSALVVLVTLFVTSLVDVGTPVFWLITSALLGHLLAGSFVRSGRSFFATLAIHALAVAILWGGLSMANFFALGPSSPPAHDFFVYRLSDHLFTMAAFYLLPFLSGWIFWCSRAALALESLMGSVAAVWLLAGHRNYQLDAPKSLSSAAWELGVSPQRFLLAVALFVSLLLVSYIALAQVRPLFRQRRPVPTLGRSARLSSIAITLLFLISLFGYAYYVDQLYSANLSRATNGVGQGSTEGQSPLGFHSATGKTKQPAAVVRLEGDYADNPWTPMLYMREGALSEYNGKELVLASAQFDTDVPRIAPGQNFNLEPPGEPFMRKEIVQSIYLLAKHTAPFAIDYPKTFRLIKNPDPQRFELSYQAVSLAPTTKLESLIGEEVGEASWDHAIWEHYLRAPGSLDAAARAQDIEKIPADAAQPVRDSHEEDLRYAATAQQLTNGLFTPIEKAVKITQHLSEASIYTRNPGHQIGADADPVAPYLFSSEKRGYCVHFAHAAVYLFRLLGIPARIGTGYLTDLTYAKDGHILLHLGDRHAWPEIYVRGLGWVVVDVTPQRAENEQVIVPDEKLLEELMSKIDPAEELITPPPLDTEEKKGAAELLEQFIGTRAIIPIFATLALLFLLSKLLLRYGYLLAQDPRRRTRLAYASFSSLATDIGLGRSFGETRREHADRLSTVRAIASTSPVAIRDLARRNEEVCYGSTGSAHAQPTTALLAEAVRTVDPGRIPWRRFFAFFNPLSLLRIGRW